MESDKLQTGDLVERRYLSIKQSNGMIGVPSVPELVLVLDVDDIHYAMFDIPTKKTYRHPHSMRSQYRLVQRISSGAQDEV